MSGCRVFCREEFRLSAFSLGGTNPALFASPQGRWLGMPWTFIFYRLMMALYQTIWFILVLVYWGEEPFYRPVDTRGKWFIYVSNWTFTLVTTYLITAAITTIYWQTVHGMGKRSDDVPERKKTVDLEMNANNPVLASQNDGNGDAQDSNLAPESARPVTPWYFIVQRYLQTYACAVSVFVTILFWVLEYDPETTTVQAFNTHVHGVAAILMIIDTLLVATPVRFLHMIYVMITAFIYFCFTAIYHACGGKNPSGGTHIYSNNLDWAGSAARSAIVAVIVVFVAAPVCHLLFYALYRLRLALASCYSCCVNENSRQLYIS